jgi:hypothetical protein
MFPKVKKTPTPETSCRNDLPVQPAKLLITLSMVKIVQLLIDTCDHYQRLVGIVTPNSNID